jgi:hypothetical protein
LVGGVTVVRIARTGRLRPMLLTLTRRSV